MHVLSYRPSGRLALFIHTSFATIYLLLVTRAIISFHEGPPDLSNLTQNSLVVLIIKRVCGILYGPFFAVLSPPSFESNADLIVTIMFAIAAYALVHYGMLMNVPIQARISMTDKILNLCRAIFFLAGTLLLLLIVTRMSVMLYQDIGFGRLQVGIGAPAKK
jgi:hypothetical protein